MPQRQLAPLATWLAYKATVPELLIAKPVSDGAASAFDPGSAVALTSVWALAVPVLVRMLVFVTSAPYATVPALLMPAKMPECPEDVGALTMKGVPPAVAV